MSVFQSQFDPNSAQAQTQRETMLKLLADFRQIEAKVNAEAEKSRPKFARKNKLLPRERIGHLLDRGAPFIELSTLAGYKQHDDKDGSLAGGGMIGGIGFVAGVRCMVVANNSAVKGGSISPWGLQKGLRGQEIALENKLPVVSLVESAGANLNYQAEIFVPGGRTFANQARLSAAGVPQITVVHGSSTAGGAYMPGLSDYVVMVKKQAQVYLAGPPLLKAATGEIAEHEELGGAEMHAQIAGTAEYLAENDADAVRQAREIMARIAPSWNQFKNIPNINNQNIINKNYCEPIYSPDELAGLVPSDHRQPYDCREVMARVVDGSVLTEFKSEFDGQTICAQASIGGIGVGLIGNNGPITPNGAVKAAQFIQLCNQIQMPIIFLQNTTGFLVGTQAEQGGIVKHGSKMLQAVANSRVPHITLLIGGSFGAGNYGMCGRGLSPRFIFAWPNARTAVMGGEQAAKVLTIIGMEKLAKMGQTPTEAFFKPMADELIKKFDTDSHAFNGSARLWDDGIIDPRDSRKLLIFLLETCIESELRTLTKTSFGVARL